MSQEAFASKCMFYDSVNYPHGFARSGVFTKRESEILSSCGYVITQLLKGDMEPQNFTQKDFIKVVSGKRDAESEVEKAWMKYQNSTSNKRNKISSISRYASMTDLEYREA